MASITSPDFPDERLIVCRNPDLAAKRAHKRQALLEQPNAIWRAFTPLSRANGNRCAALPHRSGCRRRGRKAQNAQTLRSRHHRYKLTFARKTDASPPRPPPMAFISCAPTSLPRCSTMRPPCGAINPCPRWNVPSVVLKRRSPGPPVRHWLADRPCSRLSCACLPITWSGTCARSWRRCCSMTRTKMPPKPHGKRRGQGPTLTVSGKKQSTGVTAGWTTGSQLPHPTRRSCDLGAKYHRHRGRAKPSANRVHQANQRFSTRAFELAERRIVASKP